MERRISLTIERGSYDDIGIWKDVLLKDAQVIQSNSLRLEMPFIIRKRASNEISIHSRMLEHPFRITIYPNSNKIEYQQGRDQDIFLVSSIKDNLKEKLKDYFNQVADGERALRNFEFTDREANASASASANTSDPTEPNQTAGKRHKKTRRHRRS